MGTSLLEFQPGLAIQAPVWKDFGLQVSPVDNSRSAFFLVISFGCCKHRLSPHSVGLLLQSTIEGNEDAFRVFQLAPRVFRFSVSSKNVGFFIASLRSYDCSEFKAYFHLWNSCGLNWKQEYATFAQEEASSWRQVSKVGSSSGSYLDAAKKPPLT
jgi:hypothetical protein